MVKLNNFIILSIIYNYFASYFFRLSDYLNLSLNPPAAGKPVSYSLLSTRCSALPLNMIPQHEFQGMGVQVKLPL